MPFEPLPLPPRCTPRRLACISVLATLLVARPATAQDSPPTRQDKAAAQVLFDRALVDMQAGRFDQACPLFTDSLLIYRAPGTLFTLAECEASRGNIATALALYDEYLALYETLPPEKKAAQGTRPKDSLAEKATLGQFVPKLIVMLPKGAPSKTQVTLDGQDLPAAKLGTTLFVNPGEHRLTAAVPGGPMLDHRLILDKGDERKIELEVYLPSAPSWAQSPAQAGAPAAPGKRLVKSPSLPDIPPGGSQAGAYVLGSLGIAGLVLSGVTGGLMLANKGVIDANCTDDGAGVALCRNPAAVDAGNQAKTLGLVSTVGLGVGIAGLGAATILLLTQSSSPKQTSMRAPSHSAEPRWWVSATSLSGPQSGALLQVQGTF